MCCWFGCFIFETLVNRSVVERLAPIAVVMLPEGLTFEAVAQHLNGKREAYLLIVLSFRY